MIKEAEIKQLGWKRGTLAAPDGQIYEVIQMDMEISGKTTTIIEDPYILNTPGNSAPEYRTRVLAIQEYVNKAVVPIVGKGTPRRDKG